MSNIKSAKRYAKSLLDLATEKGQVDDVLQDVGTIGSAIEDSKELQLLLQSPVVKADKKVKILDSIFAGKVGALCQAFIQLVTKKGREANLHAIAVEFVNLVKTQRNILTAIVESAAPLDADAKAKVMDLLKAQTTGEIELEEVVNPDLIGGFTLRTGDTMIDASVAGKLRSLRKEWVGTHMN